MARIVRIAALFAVALLPACGGHPGGGGGHAPPPPPFQRAGPFDERVNCIALAADGSGDVFASGWFTHAGNVLSNYIARIRPDGSPDPVFAVGSKMGFLPYVLAPATDGSGDLYVGGSFAGYDGHPSLNMVRVNRDGSYDAGFVVGTGFNNSVDAIVPMNDGSGSVLVGGDFTSYNGTPALGVIKLKSDGSVDPGFAVGAANQTVVRAIALANDGSGKVYVGGLFHDYGTSTLDNVVRLNSDGTVDSTFAVPNGGISGTVDVICPAPDGSGDVYFSGSSVSMNYLATTIYGIVRLHGDGSIDGGFIPSGFDSQVWSIIPVPGGSGDLYVGGDFVLAAVRLARVHHDGSIDPTFVTGTGFPLNCSVKGLANAPGGGLYVGGDFYAYRSTGADGLLRVLPNGDADPAFRVGAGGNAEVDALAAVGDGSGDLYLGGDIDFFSGAPSRGIARTHPDGTANPVLNVGSGANNQVYALAPAMDGTGDFYVGGAVWSYNGTFPNFIIRIHANGVRDAGFGGTGFSNNTTALAASLDGSGDVYVGGFYALYNGVSAPPLVRLHANGVLDAGFAAGTGPAVLSSDAVCTIVPVPGGSGDLYIGGDFNAYDGTAALRIARIHSNGKLDAGFAIGTGFDKTVRSILLASDGSGDVYVGGDFTTYQGVPAAGIIRLSSTGSRVSSFAVGSGFDLPVKALAAATDGTGDLYAGGSFTTYQGATAGRIARLRTDGSAAPAFVSGSGFNYDVRALVSGPGGRVYVGGTFRAYKTSVADRIVRLNGAGDLD